MRIAVAGGGPAGLYFARLVAKARPDFAVTVFEQNPRGATWGFGVGLGGRSMREIEALDPEVHARLVEAMTFGGGEQNIHLNGEDYLIGYSDRMGAIARLTLLDVLETVCEEAGVSIRHEERIENVEALAGYDLIVAADGVNSALRRAREDQFHTEAYQLTNHFAWYGVGARLDPSALVFRTHEGGTYVGHYYPYSPTMSTFVAECDRATWVRHGLESKTDAERRERMEAIFAPELRGASLIENRSMWRQFPVVTNRCWFAGNLVLLGDSLRSAHFSIGSGTRLAMEDAAALASAVIEADSVERALHRFVETRSAGRAMFGEAAERSFRWYENVAGNMRQPMLPFIYDFLTRTGRISDERLGRYAPQFWADYRAYKHKGEQVEAA